jgi:hypothetical protein
MTGAPSSEDKMCRSCGRRIEWRKKWERNWDQVLYCSTACRRRGVTEADRQAEDAIRYAVHHSAGATSMSAIHWDAQRAEILRRAARRMVAAGEIEMIQGGRVVDPSTTAGEVSIRRVK